VPCVVCRVSEADDRGSAVGGGDERAVLPVTARHSFEGVGDVCLSQPAIVGRAGVLTTLDVPMNDAERAGLLSSAAAIRRVIDEVS
jgi:L-lactate dehydrogenase